MIEHLSPAASFDAEIIAPSPQLFVTVTYDAADGTVQYQSGDQAGKQLSLSITVATEVVLSLTTKNPDDGGSATFYGFNVSASWTDQLKIGFQSATEMHVEVPPALTGNFTFTPQIEATGAPILAPGSVTLFVSTGGFGNPPDEGIVIPIEVTYDPTQKRQITYSPDAVQVAGKTTGLITLTIKTVGTGTPATFNGFAPNLQPSGSLSPWPDAMKILVTTSKITIVDPNLPGEGISGQSFGFSPIYNFPAGSVTSNPDPTIANADIPPVDLGPDQVIV